MKIILGYIKLNLKIYFQYRATFLFSLAIDSILLLFKVQVFKSIYMNNQTNIIVGYTFSQMIWYFAGINFIFYLIWSFTDTNLSGNIISGEMVVLLSKPISIIKLELSKAISLRICSALFEFLPSFFIYMIIVFPDFLTFAAFSKFIIICLFSFILFYQLSFLIGMSAFKIQNIESLQIFKIIIFNIAAGAFIPIEFYPELLQKILKFLPFKYICYVPVQFLLNKPEISEWNIFIFTILIQIFWIIVFYLLYKIFWKKAIENFNAAGG